MVPDLLDGVLWFVRMGVRSGYSPVYAGNGMADPAYRPPRLPYVSVVGPLSVEVEPERTLDRNQDSWILLPGHLAGRELGPADSVPAGGALAFLFDGDARVTLDLTALPSGDFGDDGVARNVAAALQAALDAASYTTLDGGIITDGTRLTELRQVAARWDSASRRLVISSGRMGPVEGGVESSVAVVDAGAGDQAEALGLGTDAVAIPGRLNRHREPASVPMAVDVRLDLWASSQATLASMVDTLAWVAPSRGQVLTRPALLAADVADGDTALTLLDQGQPGSQWTLLHWESTDGLIDRSSNIPFVLSSSDATLQIAAGETATAVLRPSGPVPDPVDRVNPFPHGVAVTLQLSMSAGGHGDRTDLLVLEYGSQRIAALAVQFEQVDGEMTALLSATAELWASGIAHEVASTGRLAAASLASASIHMRVDARAGVVELFVNSTPLPTESASVHPGGLLGGTDMPLTLGSVASTVDFTTTALHIACEPLGPYDPALRSSVATASSFAPGDQVVLARSADGLFLDQAVQVQVLGVDGAELQLASPVQGEWPRGSSLVVHRAVFFQQVKLRRRDDLLNQLFRFCAEYRLSTQLDSTSAWTRTPLVETTEVSVDPTLTATHTLHRRPGVTAHLEPPTRLTP